MKKIDFTKADRTMSTRVEEYVKVRILRKAIQKDYSDKIKAIDSSLENLEKLKGSLLEDSIPGQRALYVEQREALIKACDEQIAKECTFEYTENDKNFKKALKGVDCNNTDVVSAAVITWFKAYNLDVTDTYFLNDIISAIGGKEDYHKLVDTDGENGVSVDNNRALSTLYWVAFNAMVVAGTISKAQIPDIIKNNYGEVAKQNKAKAKAKAKVKAITK